MVHSKLKLCKTDVNPVLDLAWCLPRQRPRGVVHIRNGSNSTPDQIIPLRYGFYHNLSRDKTSYTTVTYSTIIDAKPADKATMPMCKDMSAAFGFSNN